MRVVEQNFDDNGKTSQLRDAAPNGRNCWIKEATSPWHEWVCYNVESRANDHLVEEHQLDAALEIREINLGRQARHSLSCNTVHKANTLCTSRTPWQPSITSSDYDNHSNEKNLSHVSRVIWKTHTPCLQSVGTWTIAWPPWLQL